MLYDFDLPMSKPKTDFIICICSKFHCAISVAVIFPRHSNAMAANVPWLQYTRWTDLNVAC